MKIALGWDQISPGWHAGLCKRLRGEGLHTLLGMVGYCMKDNEVEHFEFVHHNASYEDLNER